jgi:MarR family transcriptional regulator for hemolysin
MESEVNGRHVMTARNGCRPTGSSEFVFYANILHEKYILMMTGMQNLDHTLMNFTMSLTQAARAYKSVADKMVADFGLSQATAWPVVMIGRLGDGVRPGAVAEALGLEPSSLVRVIDQLIDSGLVERYEDASDRRARTLHLTAKGRRCAAQLEKALASFRRKLFEGVDRADIDACARVFDVLNHAISRFGEPSTDRKAS